jgi:hypothetical protein
MKPVLIYGSPAAGKLTESGFRGIEKKGFFAYRTL